MHPDYWLAVVLAPLGLLAILLARPGIRVGVASGEVHAGVVGAESGHRKHAFVGDVVNLAARLQAEAPVDGVLIGAETYRQLGERALAQALPPRKVKGKREPVEAYVLHSVRR